MGQIYSRTYFPTGYMEWIGLTKLGSNENTMTEEDYNTFIINPKHRETIMSICDSYSESKQKIKKDMIGFLKEIIAGDPYASSNRIVYDIFVGNVFCNFWLKLIDQPMETINKYYTDNVPKVEDTFYQVEKKYNLHEIYPAQETIRAYKHYT